MIRLRSNTSSSINISGGERLVIITMHYTLYGNNYFLWYKTSILLSCIKANKHKKHYSQLSTAREEEFTHKLFHFSVPVTSSSRCFNRSFSCPFVVTQDINFQKVDALGLDKTLSNPSNCQAAGVQQLTSRNSKETGEREIRVARLLAGDCVSWKHQP